METTSIKADETVSQIQRLLGRYGASAIMTEYEDGKIKSLSFRVKHGANEIPFRLPCRHGSIYKILSAKVKRYKSGTEEKLKEQAHDVAWRQIFQWIQAQMALIQTEMVTMPEVFMPYIQVDVKGTTLFQRIEQGGFKMLEGPK